MRADSVLPKTQSAESTSTALLHAAVEIVGSENVSWPGDDALAERYADPFAFSPEFAGPPAGAIRPASTAEVQAVVRAAASVGASVWTVSQGRNLSYGGAAPRDFDSVVLDLARMNAVREVNAHQGYVVIEPGVSFFELFEHLRGLESPLMMSVPDLGWGSVIGNALERGFGYTSMGEHNNSLCGLEIVLSDGSLVRTGMSAMEGSTSAHVYKPGYGPALDGLFAQSNLGIVVSAGYWVAPRPETIASCLIPVSDPARLGALVDLVRPLMLDRTIDSTVIVGNVLALASHFVDREKLFPAPGVIPVPVLRGIAEKLGVGYWNAKFGIYGRDGVVQAKVDAVRDAARSLGLELVVATYPGNVSPDDVDPRDRAQVGIPSGEAIQMAGWRGGASPAHVDFSLVCPTSGVETQRVFDLVRDEIEAAGLDHVGGLTMFGRHAVLLSLLSFDESDVEDCARIEALFGCLLARSAAAGVAPYRAHIRFMDDTAQIFDFGGGAARELVTRIKRALDPADVLSPGKQGIRSAERSIHVS